MTELLPDQAIVYARTLGAYALNLLYGADLQPFERDNLVDIAARCGARISTDMQKRLEARQARDKMRVDEIVRLNDELARLKARRRWWKFW